MKNLSTLFSVLILTIGAASISPSFGQTPDDPIKGSHSIIKSNEALLIEIKNSESYTARPFDFNEHDLTIQAWPTATNTMAMDWSSTHAITADVNGDAIDEIIMTQYSGTEQRVRLGIHQIVNQKLELKAQLPAFSCLANTGLSTNHLVKGNFVDDAKDEFAIAYLGVDDKIHLELYQVTDASLVPVLIAQNSEIDIAVMELDNHEFNETGDHFAITAFDYDRDAIDELVLVHKMDVDFSSRSFYFQTVSFDLDGSTSELNTTTTDLGPIVLDYGTGPAYYKDKIVRISMPTLANGDIDHDGTQELAFGFIVHQQWNHFPAIARKSNLFTLQTLEIDMHGSVQSNNSPKYQLIGGHARDGHSQNLGRHRYTMTVACADLDFNGAEEIIVNGPDSLFVYSYGASQLIKQAGMPCNNHGYFFDHRGPSFAVADVDFDTSSTALTKEIVCMKYLPSPQDSWKQKLGEVNLGIASLEEGQLVEKDAYMLQDKATSNANEFRYLLALGEFDGDALHIGEADPPLVLRDMEEPRIIINAPPVHYDVFNDQVYDISGAFDGSNDFITIYTHKEGSANEIQSEIIRDWGVSGSLRKVLKVSETGIDASFEGRYGQHFSKLQLEAESYETIITVPASLDDWIYTTVTDYYIWEYPVYFNQEEIGRIMVVFPDYKGGTWLPSKSQSANNFMQHHEFGNILSYKKLSNIPDADSLYFHSPFIELNDEAGKSWSVNIEKINENQFSKDQHFGFSTEVLISEGGKVGIELEIVQFEIEAKTEIGVKGHYDQSDITTNKISVTDGIDIAVNFGALEKQTYGEVNYEVQPYAYWSTNGAFVVDYIVEPIRTNSWWSDHYSQHPDLAFILPWKYDTEKGYPDIDEDKRTETKDLIFVPAFPEAGDTVNIITRLHNYSLKDFDGQISLQYFNGDPDRNGQLLDVMYNGALTSRILIDAELPEREEMAVMVQWPIPSDIPYQPRIYALLDGDEQVTEIHENNNKGNKVLEVKGKGQMITALERNERGTSSEFLLKQNYPNPFRSSTSISYLIKTKEEVELKVFNSQGQEIQTLFKGIQQPGKYQLIWNAGNLPTGIYMYRLQLGRYSESRKMVLIR